jgi:hypothetical protein
LCTGTATLPLKTDEELGAVEEEDPSSPEDADRAPEDELSEFEDVVCESEDAPFEPDDSAPALDEASCESDDARTEPEDSTSAPPFSVSGAEDESSPHARIISESNALQAITFFMGTSFLCP